MAGWQEHRKLKLKETWPYELACSGETLKKRHGEEEHKFQAKPKTGHVWGRPIPE